MLGVAAEPLAEAPDLDPAAACLQRPPGSLDAGSRRPRYRQPPRGRRVEQIEAGLPAPARP